MIHSEAYPMAETLLQKTMDSQIFKDWTRGAEVLRIISCPAQLCVLALIKEDEDTFTVLRFFEIGNNVQVSADLRNTDHLNVMEYLMDYLSDQRGALSVIPNTAEDQYGDRINVGSTVDVEAHGDVPTLQHAGVVSISDDFVTVEDDQGKEYDCAPEKLSVCL